ncbi:SDR family oxidoreductase [Bacillus horti]|uniref:3-oxoacyl-[acyl-carrier protein] reductase n=1 Tax=Caldalkalibacillus horti TaxID=77523 RepID=A0ABT9W4I5_9BACI|nr:SDR family oxidoreductase [Bacillus horti]MDQ0168161.1 3-oxoacyl-[acyl-carrier protein] reductase [Bacillus horti]
MNRSEVIAVKRRVALVTGGATGLAVQIVLDLAKAGHDIVINYRSSEQQALDLQQQVEQLGVSCAVIQGDVTKLEDCERLIEQGLARFGTIDICVLSAGPYMFERRKMVDYSIDEWQQIINGNLDSFFYMTRMLIPQMREKKWGRIITFGFQQAGHASGWMYRAAFAAAKSGLASLTRSIAEEEADAGITINMICPGDIVGDNKEKRIKDVKDHQSVDTAPVGRPGTGEDISRVVEFLSSPQSDFITGSIIEVSGAFNIFAKHGGTTNSDE